MVAPSVKPAERLSAAALAKADDLAKDQPNGTNSRKFTSTSFGLSSAPLNGIPVPRFHCGWLTMPNHGPLATAMTRIQNGHDRIFMRRYRPPARRSTTRVTPSVSFATCMARSRSAVDAPVPLSVTTRLLVVTSMARACTTSSSAIFDLIFDVSAPALNTSSGRLPPRPDWCADPEGPFGWASPLRGRLPDLRADFTRLPGVDVARRPHGRRPLGRPRAR